MMNTMTAPEALNQLLQGMPLSGFAQEKSVTLDQIYPQERAFLPVTSMAKRQMEFATGRYCARKSLEKLGITNFPIRMENNRAPLWPPQCVGSISHTQGFTVAVTAMKDHLLGLGVDVESRARDLHSSLSKRISSPEELEQLSQYPEIPIPTGIQLLFSARESFYKALFPLCRTQMDYKQVRIQLHLPHMEFEIRLLRDLSPSFKEGDCFSGKFILTSEHVLTLVWILA